MVRFILCLLLFYAINASSVEITVDAASGRRPVSPCLYGRNNNLSDDPGKPLSKAQWQLYRDAGIRLFRDNGGNNSTKYNWRLKLTSHPDWYNNVYRHDWDYSAASLGQNMPGAAGMWAFQLIGKAAKTSQYNFNDWGYNQSQWWEGVHNNWAGEGDIDLYLMDWPADSTTGIVSHWIAELGIPALSMKYWNMDNEPEIWNGTHDDVMPDLIPAEEFMQRYFEAAKKARAAFPDIRLAGPVPANEWQWFNWDNDKIPSGSKSYTWLEYFIKRIGEEQQASGVRLLDVLDVHFYPGENKASDIVQLHRVWFDRTFNYPGANGVKRAGSGGWDNGITKEYLFARCGEWLDKYLGKGHGVTFGVSEMGIQGSDPNVTAVWYASTLGVFADEGVELFTPLTWKTGMWEVLHLFTRHFKSIRVASVSDREETVSAYSSINAAGDSLTVVLVNRSTAAAQEVHVNLSNFQAEERPHYTWMLSSLPSSETFKSRTDNALQSGTAAVDSGAFTLNLPPLSITAVLLSGGGGQTTVASPEIFPNPAFRTARIGFEADGKSGVVLDIVDVRGRLVRRLANGRFEANRHQVEWDGLDDWGRQVPSGVYICRIASGNKLRTQKLMWLR